MDFELTPEQKKFKQEVIEFLDQEITDGVVEESIAGQGFGPHSWDLMRKLGARGWLAPSFPKEYGGLGLSRIYRCMIQEELNYRNALTVIPGLGFVGIDMAGPVILRHASEEMKSEFLPRIARGQIEFALGYSEPEAGSDLSQITMQAIERDDYFVISGQKIFNTGCHFAQYHWLVARTATEPPMHKGLSIFIVDLKTLGITVNPLWEMSGTRTNEVFYDDVIVPKKYLVGEKNMGWYYMLSALDLERMMTVSALQRGLEELVLYTKATLKNGVPLIKDSLVRHKLAEMAIEISVGRNLVYRVMWLQDNGIIPNYETAGLKVFVSELHQRFVRVALDILGMHGLLRRESKYSVLDGMMERDFRGSFLMSIGGGTSEIMRNVIAVRGAGLPRS
jgi:alkylation response protein AidB-like acyl-CoA dehydrogenase